MKSEIGESERDVLSCDAGIVKHFFPAIANLLDAVYDVLAEQFDVSSAHRVNKGDASRPAEPEFLSDFSNEVDVALLANGD